MKISENQFEKFKKTLQHAAKDSPFYNNFYKDKGVEPEDIKTPEDIVKLPTTDKYDLRCAYPLDIQAVPDEDVVRIHSSSGTTGQPVIIPYTENDVKTWGMMMARCMAVAGVSNKDRVQITPGYGLWTAGIGFQRGTEMLGAMAIPMGPGNTEKQIKFLIDLQSTVLCATSSYALLLAEEITRRSLKDKIKLRCGIVGSERWGNKMRNRIMKELGIDIYDIYGLTEIYGPGISVSCREHNGLHYWNDQLYFEILDPETGKNLPDGELGELTITTLTKEAAPLIRYRTHDLTRLLPEKCPCGLRYPRHDIILGRTDDMIKIKAVNIYPGQIEDVLKVIPEISSEYQIILDRGDNYKDFLLLRIEITHGVEKEIAEEIVKQRFKTCIGIAAQVEAVPIGTLPRSEKKTLRVIDKRYC
ncbi:phenylacetate--CoA ligase family protein [Pectinatus frisingensis]|jgi:phenylacetate-CoA ligase|uniref:phenylacetate--CoA ligase family protein n=1 Tax=Pectinatus frisingensis TaxID=865 RepID=UPI0018C6B8B9|nr:phenylacetate--CoA ligase [Pectinatus frisingensis]